MDTLQGDLRLSRALQEHAVRVMQVVEKVIGRIQNLEKVSLSLLSKHFLHVIITFTLIYSVSGPSFCGSTGRC